MVPPGHKNKTLENDYAATGGITFVDTDKLLTGNMLRRRLEEHGFLIGIIGATKVILRGPSFRGSFHGMASNMSLLQAVTSGRAAATSIRMPFTTACILYLHGYQVNGTSPISISINRGSSAPLGQSTLSCHGPGSRWQR